MTIKNFFHIINKVNDRSPYQKGKKKKQMRKFYSRKDGIILTAIEILNELGFQALSIREIAKRQDMAESLLYKNYKSKDELIIAVLKYYSKYDSAIMNTILKNENTYRGKIIDFASSYTEYYQNYPAITSVLMSYDSFLHEESTRELVTDIFKKRSQFISDLASNAIAKGELKDDFTPGELSEIVIGLFRNVCFIWRLENFGFSLKDRVNSLLEKLLK